MCKENRNIFSLRNSAVNLLPLYRFQLRVFTARCGLRKVLFLAPSACVFLFVYEMSREPLNGFAPNSHGRCVWSLARMAFFGPFGGLRAVYA